MTLKPATWPWAVSGLLLLGLAGLFIFLAWPRLTRIADLQQQLFRAQQANLDLHLALAQRTDHLNAPVAADLPVLFQEGPSRRARAQETDLGQQVSKLVAAHHAMLQDITLGPPHPGRLPGIMHARCRLTLIASYPRVRSLILALSTPPWLLRMDDLEIQGKEPAHLKVRLGLTLYWAQGIH